MANQEKNIKKTRGPLSREQRQFIEDNYDTMTVKQMAEKINRTPETVKKHVRQLPAVKKNDENATVVEQLHVASFWPGIKRSLVGEEVQQFENDWAKYANQFGSLDIVASDEVTIRDLIMSDIHSIRCYKKLARIEKEISAIEKNLESERNKKFEDQDAGLIQTLSSRLSEQYSAHNSMSKEGREYESIKQNKLKLLKATREQRFKNEEAKSKDIVEMMKNLDDVRNRIREGRLAEKYKMSAKKIADDWNEVVTFENDENDKVLLSPEGEIADLEREKKEKEKNYE